jgi:hypothetical protein
VCAIRGLTCSIFRNISNAGEPNKAPPSGGRSVSVKSFVPGSFPDIANSDGSPDGSPAVSSVGCSAGSSTVGLVESSEGGAVTDGKLLQPTSEANVIIHAMMRRGVLSTNRAGNRFFIFHFHNVLTGSIYESILHFLYRYLTY